MLFQHVDENVKKPIASRIEILQFNFDGQGSAIVQSDHGFLDGTKVTTFDARQVRALLEPSEEGGRSYYLPQFETREAVIQLNAAAREYRKINEARPKSPE